jgi:hypothetical protein
MSRFESRHKHIILAQLRSNCQALFPDNPISRFIASVINLEIDIKNHKKLRLTTLAGNSLSRIWTWRICPIFASSDGT